MSDWRPTISLKDLQARATVLAQIRKFFARHAVLEVETPLACSHTVTEPNIESFAIAAQPRRYLQTSPEYSMKRLLAAGAPDIYQICKSFRQGELGRYHNPEFTLIEWYRLGYSLEQMMQETVALIMEVVASKEATKPVQYMSYNECFANALGTSFTELNEQDFDRLVTQHGLQSEQSLSRAQKIDFIFSNMIATQFDATAITCIYHYPAEQAALAKINADNPNVAERFEVFCGAVELANGYVELVEADIQLARFEYDQQIRQAGGLEHVEIDQRLLDAQKCGLPDCAGVAVGLDRLLMLALNAEKIEEVMSFSWENA